MRKLYVAACCYAGLGLAAGLFYRELTRDHPGVDTQLSVLHTHLLALGLLMMLVLMALEATLHFSGSKVFGWFFILYNAGLLVTVSMMVWHGLLQLAGAPESPAIAGIAGLGHILLTAGIVLLLVALGQPVRRHLEQRAAAGS